jgi:hypothetical protein
VLVELVALAATSKTWTGLQCTAATSLIVKRQGKKEQPSGILMVKKFFPKCDKPKVWVSNKGLLRN